MSDKETTDVRDESTLHDSFASIAEIDRSHCATLLIHTRHGAEAVSLSPSHDVILGRGRSADVTIPERSLSREHCRFKMIGDDVWVEDLDSTNGTRVGGKKIDRQCSLGPGDEVDLGPVRVALHRSTPGDDKLRALESHDRFVAMFAEELLRARMCNRKVGLVMIRTTDPDSANLGRWTPRLWDHLHPFERAALYSLDAVEILLPDTPPGRPREVAEAITRRDAPGKAALLCGVALFPDAGTSVDELFEVTRRASRRANAEHPVVVATTQATTSEVPIPASPAGDEEKPVVASAAMNAVFETADRVAKAAIPVLIQGETGVGKEVVARRIHAESRRKGPLRCINCGAIPGELIESVLFGHERGAFTGADKRKEGVFEATAGGTLLLDEIGELPPSAQTALLRVLETKRITRVGANKEVKVDVRILAATHRDLEAMCDDGGFRRDLFFRLNAMTLRIPPLRDRRTEIEPLVRNFVQLANKANGCEVDLIESEALQALRAFRWPGNIRELRNVIERAVVIAQGNTITVEDLADRIRQPDKGHHPLMQRPTLDNRLKTPTPAPIGRPTAIPGGGKGTLEALDATTSDDAPLADPGAGQSLPFKDRIRHYEAAVIRDVLKAMRWDKALTAERLCLPRRTLQHKIRVHGIGVDESDQPLKSAWELERTVAMPVSADDEPITSRVQRYEAAVIERALAANSGNTSQTAEQLQMPLRTLQHKIRTLGVDKPR